MSTEEGLILKETISDYLNRLKEQGGKIEGADNSELNFFNNEFTKIKEKFETTIYFQLTTDEKKEIIQKAIGLIDSFHEALTGEVLWYYIGTNKKSSYIEKRVKWDQLLRDDAISFNSELTQVRLSFSKLQQKEENQNTFSNYKKHWQTVMSWFYATNKNYGDFYEKEDGEFYTTRSGHNPHPLYKRKQKDKRMYIYFSRYTGEKASHINYTYLSKGMAYRASFNAGNVKEWFDAKYYNYKEKLKGEKWFDVISHKRYPMEDILSKGDSDLGTLVGDFRISKTEIVQSKLDNDTLFSVQQVKESIDKISNKLNAFLSNVDAEHLRELLKLFKESNIADDMAETIFADVSARLGIKSNF